MPGTGISLFLFLRFGYFVAWYSLSGLRADDRILNNVIVRELYLNTTVYPIM